LNTFSPDWQSLASPHLYPLRYKVLARATAAARGNRREMIGRTLEAVKKKLADAVIRAGVHRGVKHVDSISRKMIKKHLSFAACHDIHGCRVVVPDVAWCYLALGGLPPLSKPIPGKFKD